MAQHKSAEKQARKAITNKQRNKNYMSRMKTAIKRVKEAKEKEKAIDALKKAVKMLDQVAAKGIIHANKAANTKITINEIC